MLIALECGGLRWPVTDQGFGLGLAADRLLLTLFVVLDCRQLLGHLLGQQGILRHRQRSQRVWHGEWSPRQGLPYRRNRLEVVSASVH